jgi:2,3-bisphosphoglycerate-independent phosphoglycerate mutase
MTKTVLILTDGMADEAIAELGGKTPMEYAETPNMDAIAESGASGTFFSLPEGFPTSSDCANMSVMGYELAKYYCGRGPLEAVAQGIELKPGDFAFRCNLINVVGDVLTDYSGGHVEDAVAKELMAAIKAEFDSELCTFHSGVSYRNLVVLHGDQFTDNVEYRKADAAQGERIDDILLKPADDSPEAKHTAEFLNDLTLRSRAILENHPANAGRKSPANMIWPFSPGPNPTLPSFEEKYGTSGAIISAVDVIFGLGKCADMELVHVDGATGFIDTNYEGKAEAAVDALKRHDFVYLHVEAADECGHMGDLKLKLQAINDIDKRLVGHLRKKLAEEFPDEPVTLAVLPDHPVPLRLRVHTREPVPVAICGPHITPDAVRVYSEPAASAGSLGLMKGDEVMKRILGL